MILPQSFRTLFPYVSFITALVLFTSCGSPKEQSTTEDTTGVQSDTIMSPEVETTSSEELDDFNNEDHGGPGINDTQVSFGNIELPSQNLLTDLMKKDVAKVIDPKIGFVILQPGPGVAPTASIGNSVEDVLGIDEMILLLSDSSFANNELPFYTWHFERCQAEDLPDAIYLDDLFIEDANLDYFNEDTKEKARQINKQWKGLEFRYAKVFHVKLTKKSGEQIVFSFSAFLKSDKLFLMSIDLTDCGA